MTKAVVHTTVTRKKTSPKVASQAKAKPRYPRRVVHLNPPVSNHIYRPDMPSLIKGYIQLTDSLDSHNGAILHFLYNPQSLSYNSAVMQSVLQPTYRLPADTGVAIFPGTTTLSFDLLFDRSYEMYSDSGNWTMGTLKDMSALNAITNFANGYLLQNRVTVTLGGKNAPTFDGMIASCNLVHQRFNGSMVPMTTTVSLAFTQLTQPGDPANGAPPPPGVTADPYANPQNLPPIPDSLDQQTRHRDAYSPLMPITNTNTGGYGGGGGGAKAE